MDELNVGVIPVCDGEKLVGMVTDRDIVVRGVAQKGEVRSMKLTDVMSGHVRCAREGDDIDQVLGEMADFDLGHISVASPLGRALKDGRLGDEVDLRLPVGARRLRITELVTVHQLQ